MGNSKSKQVYAFQPLPWPEALAAFRLIDQICGIATTYATMYLDEYAVQVLDKVSELQRLPFLWDVFESDFEKLRGSHMVRLASDLHSALEKLEGYKYDLGLMSEKGLPMFASRRAATEKVLAVLREVEEAHRGFHYAFELALYASLREESATNTPQRAAATPDLEPGSPVAGGPRSVAAVRSLPSRAAGSAAATPRPPDSEGYDWGGRTPRSRPASARTNVAANSLQRAFEEAASEDADKGEVAAVAAARTPRRRPPRLTLSDEDDPAAVAPTPRRLAPRVRVSDEEDAELEPLSPGPPPQSSRSTRRSISTGTVSGGGGTGRRRRRSGKQQYVVMYLPQGPDGGGPRAILVPAEALQPAPAPAPTATMSTSSRSPYVTYGHSAQQGMPQMLPAASAPPQLLTAATPAAVPTAAWNGYTPQPPPPPPQQQQQPLVLLQPPPRVASPPPVMTQQQQPLPYTSLTYGPTATMPAPAPAPPPMTAAPYINPYATSQTPRSARHAVPFSRAQRTTSEPPSSAAPPPAPSSPATYRYFSPPPAPSLHRTPSPYRTETTAAATDAAISDLQRSLQALRAHNFSSPPPPPPPPVAAAPAAAPPLSSYLHTASLGGLAPRAGAYDSGQWTAVPAPPPQALPVAPVGAVPAVVPGAAPGSILMLQPLTAHTAANGSLVLQPNADPLQPPVLVVAQDPATAGTMSMAAATSAVPVLAAEDGTGSSGGPSDDGGAMPHRELSPSRVRFRSGADVGPRRAGGTRRRGAAANAYGGLEQADDGFGAGFREEGDGDGNHLTSLYPPPSQRARQDRRHRSAERPVPTYLTHYLGTGAEGRDTEEMSEVPDVYEVYGGLYESTGDNGRRARNAGGAVDGGGREPSGAGARQLMSRFRDLWDEEGPTLGSSRGGGGGRGLGAGGLQPTPQRLRPVPPRPLPLRDAEVDLPPSAAEAVRSAGGLSYSRLAVLAGLDPDVLGGGAAAGMASLGDRGAGAAAAVPGGGGGGRETSPYVVPGESALRRAELLAEAAEGGDWAAAVELAGLVRGSGWWGDPRDGAVARGLLLQAALRGGSVDAHAALGEMAERGEGLPGGRPDLSAAARHYSAAAAGGHRDATTAYAYLLEHGLGVDQDEARAAQLYAAAAQRNCPTAANNLGKMLLDGRGGIAAAANATSLSRGAKGGAHRQVPGTGRGTAASGTWTSSAAAAAAAAAIGGGPAGGAGAPMTPLTLAKALFKRAAKAGSAPAWYNLGVCQLQELKQLRGSRSSPGAGTGGSALRGSAAPAHQPYADAAAELESEALRCFGEAARRGHARAALRAGHLYLQRSNAAGAVEAFCTAAINAASSVAAAQAQAQARRSGAGGWDGAGSAGGSSAGGASARPGGGSATAAAALVEAEALWCLAQLAERQAAVLEVKTSAGAPPSPLARPAAAGPSVRARRGGPGSGSGSEIRSVGVADQGPGGEEEGAEEGRGSGGPSGSRARSGAGGRLASGESTRIGGPGAGGGDGVSTVSTGTESRAVGQLLANLAASGGDAAGPEGAVAAAAAAATAAVAYDAALDDPAAAAAVAFARDLCRLNFECCRRPPSPLPSAAAATAAAGGELRVTSSLKVHGLRRLRRQARELLAEMEGGGGRGGGEASAAAGGGDSRSSTEGSALGEPGPMAAALARLDLELQQPGERAQRARRAAADLMAAAAALGHAAAQHWLAGWQWSMGRQASAVTLWEAAGRRGHGASLMVLGQMAEAGQLPQTAAVAAKEGRVGEAEAGGAGNGADLAAAARYYLRAQQAGAPGAVDSMQRVQRLLRRHVALQGRLEAVAAVNGGTAGATGSLGSPTMAQASRRRP